MTLLVHHAIGEFLVDRCHRARFSLRGAHGACAWSVQIGTLGVAWVPLGRLDASLARRVFTALG